MEYQIDNSIVDHDQNEKLAQASASRSMFYDLNKEAMKAFVENIDDVNQRILPNKYLEKKKPNLIGSTALHLAYEESNFDLFGLLMEKGVDFCIKNRNSLTVLHLALLYSNYLKNYLEYDVQFMSVFEDSYSLNLAAINSILDAHVDTNNSRNPCDKNGLSHFHIACLVNRTRTIEFFLRNGVSVNQAVNKNSTMLPGFTPLHIAAKYHNVKAAEILLRNNANKYPKDAKGMSCLHVLIEERFKYSFCESMQERLRNDESVFHIYANNNRKIIELLFGTSDSWNPNTTDSVGLSLFHLACTLKDVSLIEKLMEKISNIHQAINMDSPIWSGYTALHFAAHFDLDTVKLLIKFGADLGLSDVEGLTPFEVCLQRFTPEEMCSILELRTDWKNILFSDGKTRLFDFVHAMRNKHTFKEFLVNEVTNINMFISMKSGIAAGYTPLHFAVIATGISKTNLKACDNADYQAPFKIEDQNNETGSLIDENADFQAELVTNESNDDEFSDYEYEDSQDSFYLNKQNNKTNSSTYYAKIAICLSLDADFTILDRRGLTPLHHSFQLHEYHAASLILGSEKKIVNSIDAHGTSHFHIACVVSVIDFIKKLLSTSEGKEAINDPVRCSFTYFKKSNFEQKQKSIRINKGSTPLHIAVALQNFDLVELLIKYDVDISAQDVEGSSPLDLAIVLHKQKDRCLIYDEDDSLPQIIKLLIKYKVNVIAHKYSSSIPLKQILQENDIFARDLLVLELEEQNLIERCILDDMGISKLHIVSALGNIEKIKQLLDKGENVNAQVHFNSPVWPGSTPINLLISRNRNDESVTTQIVKLLLNYGAEVTIANIDQITPIHEVFELLQDDYDKSWFYYKELKNHLSPFYELLVDAQKNFDVNPVSIRGLSHFHVACALNKVEVVEKFLEHNVDHGKKINSFTENFPGYTPLHFAVHFEAKDTIDLLLKYGVDINSRDISGNTPLHVFALDCASRSDILESLLSKDSVDMNALSLNSETFIEAYLRRNRKIPEVVEVMKKYGCNFNAYNAATNQGYLALFVESNDRDDVEAVFNVLDVNDLDMKGRNFIHNLVSIIKHDGSHVEVDYTVEQMFVPPQKYCDAIEILMFLDSDINHQDEQGLTALHVAAQRRNCTGVTGLLMSGADINLTDTVGKSAFAYSMEMANNSPQNTPVDFIIIKSFLKHAHKLKTLHLDLTPQIINFHSILNKSYAEWVLEIVEEDVNNEIAKIKNEKWRTCLPLITLENFLRDTSPIKYSILDRENRDKIDAFFKNNISTLREEFPELSSILLLQYGKARARLELIELADNCLSSVIGVEVPYLCAKAIFVFLSNYDLKNLIISSNFE